MGDRFGGAVTRWGHHLRCGPNAAWLAAWHDDITGDALETVVIPYKLHGELAHKIGVLDHERLDV